MFARKYPHLTLLAETFANKFSKRTSKGITMSAKETTTTIINQHAKNIIYITNVKNINELENEPNEETTKCSLENIHT